MLTYDYQHINNHICVYSPGDRFKGSSTRAGVVHFFVLHQYFY